MTNNNIQMISVIYHYYVQKYIINPKVFFGQKKNVDHPSMFNKHGAL